MSRWVTALAFAVTACSGPKADSETQPAAKAPALAGAGPKRSEVAATFSKRWTFDGSRLVEFPELFSYGETNPHNYPATWAVVAREDAPSPPNAFGVTRCENPEGAVFEVALADDTNLENLEAEVSILAVDGKFDRGGGIIWRARDENNYYVARWNPVEGNVRFYVVVDSVRSKLAELSLELDATAWHEMRLVVSGAHFEVSMDDHPPLILDDTTLVGPGKIGLWTKSDAKTLFDDSAVTEL